ncbi:MAG: hypothetical protein WBL25_02315 [Anaerolineales bacterium]
MKRTAVLVLAMTLLLSSCIPALPQLQLPSEAPVVDVQATDAAMVETHAVETLNALPTPTLEPATDTPEPTATDTESPTATEATTETLTPDPNITATETGTVVTSTATGFVVTATETLHPRFFGTLPPAIPYGNLKLVNKSKAEAYISLQCTTIDGYTTIIEYPVYGRMRISAPAGKYTYVAWVGGRQYHGSFGLGKGNEIEIIIDKGKIILK